MALRERLAVGIAALLGLSTYEAPPSTLPSLDDAMVEQIRKAFGGNLYPTPTTRTRWYIADLERATHAADQGDLSIAAQLCQASMQDGVLAGMMSTRTNGLVRLPKRFYGEPKMTAQLDLRAGTRSIFDDMCPPSELALLVQDGLQLGVGIAELLPVEGRDFPVLCRLDPQHLRYRWNENRWYYNTIAGLLPILPGDGRWVLHVPQGRVAPWRNALWRATGQAWIDKTHARLHQANWEKCLANPARAAVAPQGATESQRLGFFQRLLAWGVNTVFELPPGWDVRIVESNGRGWESFVQTIERAEREFMIALAGQTVTTDGGTGFANADIHRAIRADLIDASADQLAYTINTQVLPAWVLSHFGVDALAKCPIISWDTTPPKDLKADGEAMKTLGDAIATANQALAPYNLRVDAKELAAKQGLPIQNIDGTPLQSEGLPEQKKPQDFSRAA